MKKLILNNLIMGFPILTSLSFISCNERKQFYNVLNKNKGVFKINKIESNNNDIYKKIFKKNDVLFQFGNCEGIKNNYIEKEHLFTYIYKNVDKKLY
jgi:lipoprotein